MTRKAISGTKEVVDRESFAVSESRVQPEEMCGPKDGQLAGKAIYPAAKEERHVWSHLDTRIDGRIN
jgi:hypothetical protein